MNDHFDGRRFFNPNTHNGVSQREVPKMLLTPRTPWPRHIAAAPLAPPALRPDDRAVITFIGHASFLVQTHAGNLLLDPIFSERASPVRFAGPRRVRPPGIAFESLPPIALVLVSHNHYDHCDLRTLRRLARAHDPQFITTLGNARLLRSAGARRVQELDWWDGAAGAPTDVTVTPAQHFSARTPFDRNLTLWGGFFLRVDQISIFFAADSGYGPHFRAIRERLGTPDVALLPIGAYEPRWFMHDIHMNPAEAVQAHRDLDARQSVAMHYGTFQLTPEGFEEPVVALKQALLEQGVPASAFVTPAPGDSLSV